MKEFFFYFLGIASLILPTYFARNVGLLGIGSIIVGTGMGTMYWKLLTVANMHRIKTIWIRKMIMAFLLFHVVILAGFVSYVFAHLTQRSLVQETSSGLLLLVILLVAGYGAKGGKETRRKVFEVMFWFVVIPLLIMFAFVLKGIQGNYFIEGIEKIANREVRIWEVLDCGYVTFLFLSVSFFFRPLQEKVLKLVKEKQEICAVRKALIYSSLFLIFIYVLTYGTFGEWALAKMEYPAVTLMSTIHFSGSFLKRLDALMFGIWFFTLFALLFLFVDYGKQMLVKLTDRKKKVNQMGYILPILVAIFLVGIGLFQLEGAKEICMKYIKYVGTPILIMIPLVTWLFSACSKTELEERAFPLMVALSFDEVTGDTSVDYAFPGEEEIVNANAYSDAKQLDFNHLKVLVVDEKFYEQEDLVKELLEEMRKEETFPRNTYVCKTSDVERLLSCKGEVPEDLGTYLEEFLDKNLEEHKNLGMWMDDKDYASFPLPLVEWNGENLIIVKEISNQNE